jgi:PAS domain S-box-containing protein
MKDVRQQLIERRIEELQENTDFVNNLLKRITGYAIIVGDFDGNIIVFNEGAKKIFGFEPQDVVGLKNIEDFYPARLVEAGILNMLFDKLLKEGDCLYELDRNRNNGETFSAQSLLTLVKDNDGRLVGFVEIIEDITERKNKEKQLKQANERLLELSKIKDDFVSIASHELRTPLSSIKNFTELLLTYEEDRTTQKEFLNIIYSESERLINIINDFLDISKIQAGRMQWQKIELSLVDIIQQVVQSNQTLINEAKLELATELEPDLPSVLGEKDRIVQVMTNLLGNSIKFTSESGKVIIRAWLEKNQKAGDNRGKVIVSVSDSGIGIARENFGRIFETFGQVGNGLKNKPRGTGLGLPICKKIVEYFGGKIWVESELGKGSTFFFSLPCAAEKSSKIAVLSKI